MITQRAKVETPPEIWHILPSNDLKNHDNGLKCWCAPEIRKEPYNRLLVIHNSADGREFYEVPEGH